MYRFLLLACLLAVPAEAQMKTGAQMARYGEVFGIETGKRYYDYDAVLKSTSAPGNIFHPGEAPRFSFQLQNRLDKPIQIQGRVELVPYSTRGLPGDIWLSEVHETGARVSVPIAVDMAAGGWQDFELSPEVPERKGGYALVVDLGEHGRRFLTGLVRTFKPAGARVQHPKQSLEEMPPAVLERMGIQAIRKGIPYVPTSHERYGAFEEKLAEELRALHEHQVTVVLEVGAGEAPEPLGRSRPHLDRKGVMRAGKADQVWLPEWDDDYQAFVQAIAAEYGWPRGPVTGFMLWNEPWEGRSISGWQADMPRYRELYVRMAKAVHQARAEAGVDVLVGGCDSSSNTWDKLFADGSQELLPYLDFCSIHYQGLDAPVLYPEWRSRAEGRVLVWDTESWVANAADRFAAVVATNRAAGYDRSMGIYYGNVTTQLGHGQVAKDRIYTEAGSEEMVRPLMAWPPAAAVGAVQHFVGERDFAELLFKDGLPWVFAFAGLDGDEEDGTLVVVGDVGAAFARSDQMLWRTVRSLHEIKKKEQWRAALAGAEGAERENIKEKLQAPLPFVGADMKIAIGPFALYDFYGNEIAAADEVLRVPLDARGFFLRGDGTKGAFQALVAAVREARIGGIEPLEMVACDMTEPVGQWSALRLALRNPLNRAVEGAFAVELEGLEVEAPEYLRLGPHERRELEVRIVGGAASADNRYPMRLEFDAGEDGRAIHYETMRVNWIARRSIEVDGRLDDWAGVLPQTIRAGGGHGRTLQEAAWLPFARFEEGTSAGLATGYLAYDDEYFYFAVKVVDDTPHAGTLRFAERDDEAFYYPEVSYEYDQERTLFKVDRIRGTSNDPVHLLRPIGDGRVDGRWENEAKARAFAIDLTIPEGKPRQVALYIPPGDFHPNGMDLELYDRKEKKLLDRQHLTALYQGVYAVYELAGKVRIRLVARGWNYRARLGGIFFDPAEAASGFEGFDYDTSGDWIGRYGAEGFYVVGAERVDPPDISLRLPKKVKKIKHLWPQGVRRFSYRQPPILPSGDAPAFDNVQIAFNAIAAGEDGWLTHLPGRVPGFVWYKCSDYEYALNKVAKRYGNGFEVWRLQAPGMPRKHFYPRQPVHPLEGAVAGAVLKTVHKGNTRISEVAIPWGEIPEVKALMEAGKKLKFSFRVNDDRGPSLELARGRSVSKINSQAFHVDWKEHWANEVEFGWERE